MNNKLLQAIGTALLLSWVVIWYVLNVVEFKPLAVVLVGIMAFGAIGMWKYVFDQFQNRK